RPMAAIVSGSDDAVPSSRITLGERLKETRNAQLLRDPGKLPHAAARPGRPWRDRRRVRPDGGPDRRRDRDRGHADRHEPHQRVQHGCQRHIVSPAKKLNWPASTSALPILAGPGWAVGSPLLAL